MKIVEGFLFNDELELLELKLMETYDHIDRFVIVEAAINWQKKDKPLFYSDNASRFVAWRDKIVHVIAKPEFGDPPAIEWSQRREIAKGFDDLDMMDICIVSDADEICSRGALKRIRKFGLREPVALNQYLYYYFVDCLQNQPWNGPVARPRGLDSIDCQALKFERNKVPIVRDGGWHFSWLGPTVEKLQWKLNCHTVEWDSQGEMTFPDPGDTEFLEKCLRDGDDLFGRTDEYALKGFVSIKPGTTHPETINDWLDKYPQFAARRNSDAETLTEQHGLA
jgi:beta-1,4-mannosyl-glycoprotein beta-1,4-N-acetylglucosaminyltransferase